MLTTNKELRKLLKEARAHGWSFTRGRKHIKGVHVSGKTATIAATPSDWAALQNIRKDLQLNGYARIEGQGPRCESA